MLMDQQWKLELPLLKLLFPLHQPKPLEMDMLQVLLWDLLILVLSKRVQLNWLGQQALETEWILGEVMALN